MKLRRHKNTLRFLSDGRSDIFENITKHHLYKDWRKLINHFRNRGFTFKTQQYHLDNNWGQPFNKVGFKENGVVVILDLEDKYIKADLGFKSNLWDSENNFWDDWHDKYKNLSYLENKSVQLEILKLKNKYSHLNYEEDDSNLKGVDYIIKNELDNPHIHGGAKSLEDIKTYTDNHFSYHNHSDSNKKRIVCGETKYYYDNDNILKKGVVYHHINNMWWVLSGGSARNMASFYLFDFNGQPKRRVLNKEEKLNRLEQELRTKEKVRQYDRCKLIDKEIKKLQDKEQTYRVWSIKHGCWWRSNNNGYTSYEKDAGVYLESNIKKNQSYYDDGKINKAVLI